MPMIELTIIQPSPRPQVIEHTQRYCYVLLVVGVVSKFNGRPPTSTSRGAKTSKGIELKIGQINYLGSLTKWAKFQICNPPGVVWAIG